MEISQVISLAIDIIGLLQKDSLSKVADKEIKAAGLVLVAASISKAPRECLNRVLTHLESAYAMYEDCIHTTDFLDKEKIIYHKAGKLNLICESIAEIHFRLGNVEIARKWLLDNMRADGCCNKSEYFYEEILGNDFEKFNSVILKTSESHYRSIQADFDLFMEGEGSGWGPWCL